MPSIFISYRRDATSGYAGRIQEAIKRRVTEKDVLIDLDTSAGERFPEVLRSRIENASIVIVVIGPDWRTEVEQRVRGATEQMQRDAPTFFDTDLPALLSWRFDGEDARQVNCPVLQIGGRQSGPWFAEVRDLIRTWLPQAEDVLLAGADHSLALTHAPQIADALADFLGRHPILAGGGLD